MAAIRSRDTQPEVRVRKLLYSLGFRYRLHVKELPGKPDIVFASRRKVIFVHGCFWHQHPASACLDGRRPKSNSAYWNPKLVRNMERDQEHSAALKQEGWKVFTIWECETAQKAVLEKKLLRFLQPTQKRECHEQS